MTHKTVDQREVAAIAYHTTPQAQDLDGPTGQGRTTNLGHEAEAAGTAPKVTSAVRNSLAEEFEAFFQDRRPLDETLTARTNALRRKMKELRESTGPGKEPVDINKPETLDEPCRRLLEQIKVGLAQEYNKKPLRDLFQLDALITRDPVAGVEHNSSGVTDEDGDCINCGREYERRNSGPETVRIQVPVGNHGC